MAGSMEAWLRVTLVWMIRGAIVAGIVMAIVALIRNRKYRRGAIFASALVGLLLNSLVIALVVGVMLLARRQLAALIHANPANIVFTGGGTEANNLAILGVVRAAPGASKHVVTTAIEHTAVLSPCSQLEREGVAVTRVKVGGSGVADPDDVRCALRRDPLPLRLAVSFRQACVTAVGFS